MMATGIISRQTIPAPRALPLLSWRASFLKLYRDPFTYLPWLQRTYGNIVALAEGDPSYVCAFGPELNFQVLSQPAFFNQTANAFGKLPQGTVLARLFYNNLPLLNGEKHKQQRRLMQAAFHKKQIMHYHNDMVGLIHALLDHWQTHPEIDLSAEMKLITQRIAVKTLFGLYDEKELDRIGVVLRPLGSLVPLAMVAPFDIPGTLYYRVLRLASQLETFVRMMAEQKRTQPEATDVLATLVRAHDEDGTALSDDELIGNIFTLFVAGHETTSHALTWTLFLLDQHPRVLADLLDEVDGVSHGGVPTLEQLYRMPLLEGVIKESLRLLPPASISVRSTAAPCELGGFALPEGANIIYSPYVTHRLPELYEVPKRFKPERWASLERSPYEYLPFSTGQHRCIGAEFALHEMRVVLAMLLPRYRLALVPGTRVALNVMMRPKHGMLMRVLPRDRWPERVPVQGMIHQLIDFV